LRFWDASAVVPLLVEQPGSRSCRALLRADGSQMVWCLTRTEVTSALWRLKREGAFSQAAVARIEDRLSRLSTRWHEVSLVESVRERAERLLRVHPLRAADALQLAAALVAADDRPSHWQFVTGDGALLDAVRREGFVAIRPDE
jgi:predicted nucleic acid-binding protein